MALRVSDIHATIAWYQEFTELELLDQREDADGYGAWLGHPDSGEFPFILVVAQFFPDRGPVRAGAHQLARTVQPPGHRAPRRVSVDAIAERAETAGCLGMPATQMPDPIGYICMLRDPDGNMVEFSYDQGVYEKVREVWGQNVAK